MMMGSLIEGGRLNPPDTTISLPVPFAKNNNFVTALQVTQVTHNLRLFKKKKLWKISLELFSPVNVGHLHLGVPVFPGDQSHKGARFRQMYLVFT